MGGGYYGRIGQYELRGVLGHGGTATVYRGYQPGLDREVAIKVIAVHHAQDPTFRERFRREARAIARLRHPNILAVYDFGEEGDAAYLVTELIAGGNLQGRLGRPLRPDDAVRLAQQIGQALDYAHARGIVHRDVKPANIYLDGPRAVLGDFGIAKGIAGLDAGASLTATGVGLGTPEYMSPEQALGEPLDGRADLYSLGVVLYEALTGAPPYHSAAAVDTLAQHVEGRPLRPRDRNPALSPFVEAVLLKALARGRADRYASGAELADALEGGVAAGPGPPAVADRDARTQVGPRPAILSETQVGLPPVREGRDAAATRVPPHPTPLPPLPDPAHGAPPIVPGEFGDARTRSTLPPLPLSRHVPLRAAPAAAPERASDAAVSAPGATAAGAPGQPVAPWTYPPAQPAATPAAIPLSAPPPTPAARRVPWYLWVALAAALLLLLAALGGGLVYSLVGRDKGPAPTAVANVVPTATVVAAPTPGTSLTPTSGTTPSPAPSATAGPAATATAFFAADPALSLVQDADTMLRDGRFTEAVAKYKEALARNPDSALANRQLGYTLWIWNHEAGEIDYLDRATKLAPFDALAWAYLSFSAVDTHQSERAYAAAGEALRLDPTLPEAHAAVANALVRYNPNVGNPDEAIGRAREEIERARRLAPDNLWTLWFDTVVLLADEQPEAALAPLERAIAQRPNWPTLLTARGVVHNSMGRRDEARTYLQRALALDPDYPYANAELGWLAYGDGDITAARDSFLKALAVNDIDVSAHDGLGYTLLELGDYANAVRNFERSLAIEPRDQPASIGLGRAYLEGYKRYDDALAAFRRAIDQRPLADEGYIWVARTQVAQRRFAEAETTLQGALTKVRKQGYTYYWLGWVYYQQGRHDAAQPNFERATQLEPRDASLYYWLGVNLERLDRLPEAKAAYTRALELKPDYQQAREALDDLNRRMR